MFGSRSSQVCGEKNGSSKVNTVSYSRVSTGKPGVKMSALYILLVAYFDNKKKKIKKLNMS